METLEINKQIAALINAHDYETKIVNGKIIPDFKEVIELETWIYPTEREYGMQTRFDIGVHFKNGTALFEAFGDSGITLEEAINNNIENFSRNSLHVFLDAFNDTTTYCEAEQWLISDHTFNVFIGDFNFKTVGNIEVEIPENLFETLEDIITNTGLHEDYYFIRFYYAQQQSKAMMTEFMINNRCMEKEQQRLESLSWMQSDEFYSVRHFMILKRVKSV